MAKPSVYQNPVGDYVYEILVDGIIRYVGKGKGNRVRTHVAKAKGINLRRDAGEIVKTQKFYNRLAKAIKAGSVVEHRVVAENLTLKEAFTLEIERIASHPDLWNELPGGQGADSAHFKGIWATPKGRAKFMAALNTPEAKKKREHNAALQWSDETARELNRQRTKQQWQDPEFRQARIVSIKAGDTAERRARLSEKAKAQWADPEIREHQSQQIRAALDTPGHKDRLSRKAKAMWSGPNAADLGRKISEAQRASTVFADAMASEERISRMSETLKRTWALSPERRERQSREMTEKWAKRRAKNST